MKQVLETCTKTSKRQIKRYAKGNKTYGFLASLAGALLILAGCRDMFGVKDTLVGAAHFLDLGAVSFLFACNNSFVEEVTSSGEVASTELAGVRRGRERRRRMRGCVSKERINRGCNILPESFHIYEYPGVGGTYILADVLGLAHTAVLGTSWCRGIRSHVN